MGVVDVDSKVRELRELIRMQDELSGEIEALKDELKNHMTANKLEVMNGTDWKCTYKAVTTSRIDSTALKRDYPIIADSYSKKTTSMRFNVA